MAKLELNVRLHDLRHTAASLLLAAGADIKLIADRLGDADPEFTLRVYSHLLPGTQAEAAERLAKLLSGEPRALPSG